MNIFLSYKLIDALLTYQSLKRSIFFPRNSMSAGLANAYIWTAQNWMQYFASHVATTALLSLSKTASEAISSSEHLISKTFPGEHAPRPPNLHCMHAYIHTYIPDTHVTPLPKFLAMGLPTLQQDLGSFGVVHPQHTGGKFWYAIV